MRSKTIIASGLIGLGLLGGCSGGGNTALTTVPTAHLAISLPATTIPADTPFTFTVTALDAANAVVPTYVGTVQIRTSDTSAKLPANATLAQGVGRFTVTFKTTAGQTITASDTVGGATPGTSAAISVTPPVTVSINPATATLPAGGVQAFTATVAGTSNHGVTWSVQEGAAGGSITSAGVFTAPQADGTYHVIATSNADSTKSATAAVIVSGPGCEVYPQSISVDPTGKFAYMVGDDCSGDGYVYMYTINPTTGALASIGPPVSSNDEGAESVTVDPFGKFAYVANEGLYDTDGSVSTYTINPTTGALTFTTGGIGGTSSGFCCFNSVMVHPSGKFAYVADGGCCSSNVSMYTIDATTGALTSIGTIAAGGLPNSVAVDPSGKFAYVANPNENATPGSAGNVSMYTINATTGALASIGTIAAGTGPAFVAVDPAGKFAYVTNAGSNNVSMYTINTTTGALTSMGTIAAGTGPAFVAVDPAGKFAYVTNAGSNNVSMYTINITTGALTSIGTIAAGLSPASIAIHPSGKFAYVTNFASNDVSMYSIGASGTLTLIATIGT